MKRRISLYIADRLVDLDDESLVLFNYSMEDLTNPTIVKNSYSHQFSVKGTPNNDAIFGDLFRLDRRTSFNGGNSGSDFNPSQRTPFSIYNETGEILESGYCKLDAVDRKKRVKEYKISLFGGLGSFLYSLSYDQDGGKRTLADLDYLGTGNTATELDFKINKENVATAWNTDTFEGDIDSIWKVVNFAPAYNGIPEGKFSADKALVNPAHVGLPGTIGDYTTRGGYAMVNLNRKYDEWAVKDLRSYLQRPVLSMRAFLQAVSRPENNGGYSVNMPFLENTSFRPYDRLWLTLPLIPSLGTIKRRSGDLTLTMSSTPTTGHSVARYDIGGEVASGTKVQTDINVKLQYSLTGISDSVLYRSVYSSVAKVRGKQSVIFLQMVAYGEDDTIVGGSRVKAVFDWGVTPSAMAERCGYVPPFVNGDETYESESVQEANFSKVGGSYRLDQDLAFSVECQDVRYYLLHVTTYNITTYNVLEYKSVESVSGGNSSLVTLYRNYETSFYPSQTAIVQGDVPNSISYTDPESLRSGAVITKEMLLSTSSTPADYLLSFCKIFGLHILFDKATKEISIIERKDLFQDETIDLSGRVDLSGDIGVTPFLFDSKWYEFRLEGAGGAFFDEYRSAHGIDYGVKRLNTGYDFNAETKNLLDGNVFKNASTILASSKYFNIVRESGSFRPSVFLDQGNTFTLWTPTGETIDTPVPVPPFSATIEYYNDNGNDGYDFEQARKMEFRSKDDKPLDGSGVLVFLEGFQNYPYFNLSDDIPSMDLLNDGVPCWILNPGSGFGVNVPIFQRYTYGGSHVVENSLDFGVPKELDIPGIYYTEERTLFSKFWKDYLKDRFNVDTKVMTCKVNFSGLQVGENLLRKFYWFENSLWVLNSIRNYSLTTFDPVECEFVQVQEKENYLNTD